MRYLCKIILSMGNTSISYGSIEDWQLLLALGWKKHFCYYLKGGWILGSKMANFLFFGSKVTNLWANICIQGGSLSQNRSIKTYLNQIQNQKESSTTSITRQIPLKSMADAVAYQISLFLSQILNRRSSSSSPISFNLSLSFSIFPL